MTMNNQAGLFFIGLALMMLVLHTVIAVGPMLALGYWLVVLSVALPVVFGIHFFLKDINDEEKKDEQSS